MFWWFSTVLKAPFVNQQGSGAQFLFKLPEVDLALHFTAAKCNLSNAIKILAVYINELAIQVRSGINTEEMKAAT